MQISFTVFIGRYTFISTSIDFDGAETLRPWALGSGLKGIAVHVVARPGSWQEPPGIQRWALVWKHWLGPTSILALWQPKNGQSYVNQCKFHVQQTARKSNSPFRSYPAEFQTQLSRMAKTSVAPNFHRNKATSNPAFLLFHSQPARPSQVPHRSPQADHLP